MLTIILLLVPFAAGLLLLLIKPIENSFGGLKGETVKKAALVFAIIELIIVVVAVVQFRKNAEMQFVFNYPWIKSLGINFHVAMDEFRFCLFCSPYFFFRSSFFLRSIEKLKIHLRFSLLYYSWRWRS